MRTSAAGSCDGVNLGLLGMSKETGEDAAAAGVESDGRDGGIHGWERHLEPPRGAAAGEPWILDVDTTIKPLYGRQEGADSATTCTSRVSRRLPTTSA